MNVGLTPSRATDNRRLVRSEKQTIMSTGITSKFTAHHSKPGGGRGGEGRGGGGAREQH